MVVRDKVLLNFLGLFHCQPNFAMGGENWAEMAERLDKIEELTK